MEKKEEKYILLEHFPDAFAYHRVITDKAGTPVDFIFLEVNPAFQAVTGLHRKQVLGKRVTEINPERQNFGFDWLETYNMVATRGESVRFEHYFEPADRWYEVIAYSDAPGYFATVFRDITESKNLQKALRESEERLFVTLQSIGDGVIATDGNGIIAHMNPRAEKLTGWTCKEAAGRRLEEVFNIVNAKTGEPAFNPVHHVIKTGETVGLANDTSLIARDGNRYQIADSAAPIRDNKGNISGAVMVFSDVTEQYKARKELERAMQRLEYILSATHTGIDIVDADFNLHYVDNLWQNVYGAPNGRKCYEYFKGREAPCENCGFTRALETKQVVFYEQVLPKEGNRVVECHAIPIQNEQGEWLVAEFKIDITKRKQLEEKLLFQLRFEKMISNISSSFVDIAAEKINHVINHALQKIGNFFNVDRSYIYQFSVDGKFFYNTHGWFAEGIEAQKDYLPEYPAHALPWLTTQIRNMNYVFIPDVEALPPEAEAEKKEFKRQDIQSLLTLPFSIKDDGYANGFLGFDSVREKKIWTEEQISLLQVVAEIISSALAKKQADEERNRAEKALRESEENLSITLYSIGDGVITTDVSGKITRMNPKAEKMTGWPFEEAAGKPLDEIFNIVNAKTGKPAFNPVHHVLKTGETVGLANDTSLIARDGTIYQIGDSAAPIRDSRGKITGVVMVFSDVTEQYKARQALRESEERYRTIVENINDALYIHDFNGKIIDLNETAQKMLGYERKELIGTSIAKIDSPDNHKHFPERIAQLLKKKSLVFEGEHIRKDGSLVPVEVSAKLVSEDGTGIIQGFVRDITNRKLSEKKIADYTRELEELYHRLEEEMDKARQIHERTLPKNLPRVEGFSFAAHYQPAQKLGGDFYDVVRVGNKLVIYLSDVTGHGIDGAMLSVFVKHTIKGYLSFSPEDRIRPGEILRYLSTQFRQENLPEEYFICIFLAILDLETLELTYTGAGFQDTPLVRTGNGEQVKLVSKGLYLSSYFPNEMLNFQEGSIYLTPGATVFFNTDGLTEHGVDGIYYGTRLPEVFFQNSHLPPQLIAQAICEDFRKFNNGSLQGSDDITFLILQVDPPASKTHLLELASDFEELKHLREKVLDVLGDFKDAEMFLTCVHELASNAMEHGNRLDPQKTVSIEIIVKEQVILANVKDQGEGFNWREQIDKPLELEGISERGRGIAMASICSEQLLYNDKGNRATVIIKPEGGE